jgi:hypothetical protein
MNKTSLSALYSRLTAGRLTAESATPAPDAADLASAAEGTLAADRRDGVAQALAASSANAKVVHMLRDLKTESEALAADVSRTQRETTHRRHQRGERCIAANGRRFGGALRWATAMAACMVAVVGVWTLHHAQTRGSPVVQRHSAVASSDVIFSEQDRIFSVGMDGPSPRHKSRVEGDRLFHADFSGNGG